MVVTLHMRHKTSVLKLIIQLLPYIIMCSANSSSERLGSSRYTRAAWPRRQKSCPADKPMGRCIAIVTICFCTVSHVFQKMYTYTPIGSTKLVYCLLLLEMVLLLFS